MNAPFYDSTSDSTYGSLPDTIDPTVQDSGMGLEWDFVLAGGATRTLSVEWQFTSPAAPQAPTVTNVPTGTVNTTSAAPQFAPAPGDPQVVSYECSIDGGAFTACTSPDSVSGLAEGVHTYTVRALNSAGIPGPDTPNTWTVDTTPPGAPALGGAPTATVATTGASITLSGEAGSTFRCSVDGGSYVGCSSPLVLSGLADGNHTVSVKQVDTAGNAGTLVAGASWTVDTSTPPQPDVTTPNDTTATTTDIAFTTPAGHTTECSLDNAAWQACTSPVTVSGLSAGTHTMRVRMVNAAGTAGAVKTVTWAVTAPRATTMPVATIVPAACVSRRSITVHWTMPRRATARAKAYKVLVGGKVVKTLGAKARAYKVSLAGRPAARVKVQVKGITASGKVYTTTRLYTTCASKAGAPTVPAVVLKAAKA
jgi:predicted phage tail protein